MMAPNSIRRLSVGEAASSARPRRSAKLAASPTIIDRGPHRFSAGLSPRPRLEAGQSLLSGPPPVWLDPGPCDVPLPRGGGHLRPVAFAVRLREERVESSHRISATR